MSSPGCLLHNGGGTASASSAAPVLGNLTNEFQDIDSALREVAARFPSTEGEETSDGLAGELVKREQLVLADSACSICCNH